jgi:hypothetical protein
MSQNQIDSKEVIKIEVTIQELQTIMISLVEQPYKSVAELLGKLKINADSQIKEIMDKKNSM